MKYILTATRDSDNEQVTYTYSEEVFATRGHLAMKNGGYSNITLSEEDNDQ